MRDQIEKLRQKHAEEMEKAEAEIQVIEGLPHYLQCVRHVSLQRPHKGSDMKYFPWVCYELNTCEEAILLADLFGPRHAVEHRVDSCTHLGPVCYMEPDVLKLCTRWEVVDGLVLRQHMGKGFSSTDLSFWPEGWPIKVEISIKNGIPWKLKSSVRATYDKYGNPIKREKDLVRLTSYERNPASGSMDSLNYESCFEGTSHALRILCAEEGYV